MTDNELVIRFAKERNVTINANKLGGNRFISLLNYYDAFTLWALTKQNIKYLDEEFMQYIKLHNTKLFFEISCAEIPVSFELLSIYFEITTLNGLKPIKDPIKKSERPLIRIKQLLQKRGINVQFDSSKGTIGQNYVRIKIISGKIK